MDQAIRPSWPMKRHRWLSSSAIRFRTHETVGANNKDAGGLSREGSIAQPLCRGIEQDHVLVFPDQLMPGTGHSHEHLPACCEVGEQIALEWSGSLRIQIAANDDRRHLEPARGFGVPT